MEYSENLAPLTEATRQIMWNISFSWIMYILFALACIIFAYGIFKHVTKWKKAKTDSERFSDWGKRFFILLREILFQRKVLNSAFPGLFHVLIFYSFIVLFFATVIILLDYDLGTNLFNGYFYVLISVGADIAGLFVLIGIFIAAFRRFIQKPKFLDVTTADIVALTFLSLIIITGFFIEALRIELTNDPWKSISPVGTPLSYIFSGVDGATGEFIHVSLWWLHTVLAMAWIATIPFTKFFHLLALPTNIFFSKLKPRGELKREDIEALMESDDVENMQFGLENTSNITWKQRLDFDACISCGRCEAICPANQAKQELSPKLFIAKLKEISEKSETGTKDSKPIQIIGNAFDETFPWLCRTCAACVEVCPAFIDHVDTFIDIRRNEVIMQGRMPNDATKLLKMLEEQGTPFGPQSERENWIQETGVPIIKEGEECDVLYWIGCCTSFSAPRRKIATALFEIFTKSGIKFGVLGGAETCCGDPARSCGQEYLFQTIAKTQAAEINARKFKTLLVSCPHCYNTLKNEYPQFGGNYNVVHHSEYLKELIDSKKITLSKSASGKLIYHDPCYLGRYQNIYDAPRDVLCTLPNTKITEFDQTKSKSFCCGGGGAHFWMEIEKEGWERIGDHRVNQALDKKADTLITSCPYCAEMLNTSIKTLDKEDKIVVKDIANQILESIN